MESGSKDGGWTSSFGDGEETTELAYLDAEHVGSGPQSQLVAPRPGLAHGRAVLPVATYGREREEEGDGGGGGEITKKLLANKSRRKWYL